MKPSRLVAPLKKQTNMSSFPNGLMLELPFLPWIDHSKLDVWFSDVDCTVNIRIPDIWKPVPFNYRTNCCPVSNGLCHLISSLEMVIIFICHFIRMAQNHSITSLEYKPFFGDCTGLLSERLFSLREPVPFSNLGLNKEHLSLGHFSMIWILD
jgi:hypothetical protein